MLGGFRLLFIDDSDTPDLYILVMCCLVSPPSDFFTHISKCWLILWAKKALPQCSHLLISKPFIRKVCALLIPLPLEFSVPQPVLDVTYALIGCTGWKSSLSSGNSILSAMIKYYSMNVWDPYILKVHLVFLDQRLGPRLSAVCFFIRECLYVAPQ